MKTFKSFFGALFLASLVTFLIVGALYTRVEGTQLNKEAFLLDTKPTNFKYRDNSSMVKFYKERRSVAMYEEIPQEIVDAFVATEDREFFSHAGINVKAISRAAVEIVRAKGEIVQGGSTITQQLIKMSHLDATKSIERKQQEAIYATLLEETYSKKEIMEMYLNQIEYKYQAFGIKDALRTYFGHSFEEFKHLPREERIIKAALMAGMVQNPTQIDPWQNSERTLTRRDIVIKNMSITKKITEQELEITLGKPLMVLDEPMRVFEEEKIKNQELVHYTLFEASKILDMSIEEIRDSGYDIETSFDQKVYDVIRKEFENDKNFPKNGQDGTQVEGAAVYLTPKNGEIVAFTGGRKEIDKFLDFNRAFQMQRQPGSTFKPIISYGPALESGKFGMYSYLNDQKGHTFPGGYAPKDWDGGGRGMVTMQEALRQSWNIPAVWTLQQVGLPYAKVYAKKLGVDLSKEPNYLTLALGGLENGVSPLTMADSFQAFSNDGVRTPAHAIRKITDANGKVIYEAKISTEPVIDPRNAETMKSMLLNAVQNGTGRGANFSSKIGGKTGTTEHPTVKGANNDLWFVGFSDNDLLGAVWLGYDTTNTSHYLLKSEGSGLAAKLFKEMSPNILNIVEKYKIQAPKASKQNEKEPIKQIKPTITLNGEKVVSLMVGEEYVELGVVAKDEVSGDLTNFVVVEGEVNTNIAGEYILKYQLKDGTGVVAEVTRTIIVKAAETNPDTYNKDMYHSLNLELGLTQLSWSEFKGENIVYNVYRNNNWVETVSGTSYADNMIEEGQTYEYYFAVVRKGTNEVLATSHKVVVNVPTSEPIEEPIEEPEQPVEELPPVDTTIPVENEPITPIEPPNTDGASESEAKVPIVTGEAPPKTN